MEQIVTTLSMENTCVQSAGAAMLVEMPRTAKEKAAPAEMTQPAMKALSAYCGRLKIKKEVLSRLVEWFIAQPPPMKDVILKEETEGLEDAYADALERIARTIRGGGKTGTTPLSQQELERLRTTEKTGGPGHGHVQEHADDQQKEQKKK